MKVRSKVSYVQGLACESEGTSACMHQLPVRGLLRLHTPMHNHLPAPDADDRADDGFVEGPHGDCGVGADDE